MVQDFGGSCATTFGTRPVALMLSQGVPARVVMPTLGHSQISVTLNTSGHVSPDLFRAAAVRIRRLFDDDSE